MAFKMSGPSLYKGTPLKQGRSKTKGPFTADTRTSTSDGKSRKIGPAESPETIKKNRANVTKTESEKGVFSKESSAASRKLSNSEDYVKR